VDECTGTGISGQIPHIWHGWQLDACATRDPTAEESAQRFAVVRLADIAGMGQRDYADFIKGSSMLQIPPHTHAKLLLDQGFLTNAYPQITISSGKKCSDPVELCGSIDR